MFKIRTISKFRKLQTRTAYTKPVKVLTRKAPKTTMGDRNFYTQEQLDYLMEHSRTWVTTELYKKLEKDNLLVDVAKNHTVFKLMNYNILSQDLLNSHKELYRGINEDFLQWDHRKGCLLKEIKSVGPDILCIQELQLSHLDEFSAELEQFNYDKVFKKRTAKNKTDGCAIYYRTDMFDLLDMRTVEFNQRSNYLDRDNVAIILKLSRKNDPDSVFLVACCHLLFNPKRLDVKLAQVQVLLTEIEQVAFIRERNRYHPIILAGDFNMPPFSNPYNLIVDGNLNYSNLPRKNPVHRPIIDRELAITDNCQHLHSVKTDYQSIQSQLFHSERNQNPQRDLSFLENYQHLFDTGTLNHKLCLSSVIRHNSNNPRQYASTNQDEWLTVDFIFYNKFFNRRFNRLCEGNLKLLRWHDLPTRVQCEKLQTIPNHSLGSDHLSITAEFVLTRDNVPPFPFVK